MLVYLLLVTCPILAISVCLHNLEGTPPSGFWPIPTPEEYEEALETLNIQEVIDDIGEFLTQSQACWPADEYDDVASYGPLFVRLSWHCSGTYRATDGVGGCGGGRQRFPPEASWDDNTNLDKARALLYPIKEKYGDALSWGDLMIFAGTASIINMGGPITEICAGRVDNNNGTDSQPLGPGPEQPACPIPGNCPPPLGTSTVGLIYVNPEGFEGVPLPSRSATQIREIFARMAMDDNETVALIGGGHAFGKAHGACPLGPGPPPNDQPLNPWPGNCGTGNGVDTFTSGIDGPWTSNPLKWDNQYFQYLIDDTYSLQLQGPGGKHQWQNDRDNNLMMMTTDMALISDEAYKEIVQEYASNIDSLNDAFANAWAKLTTTGGVWAEGKKCIDVYNFKQKVYS